MLVVLAAMAAFVVAAPASAAPGRAGALRALSVNVLVDAMYSQKPNGHGGVIGFDANGDGKIVISDEGYRIDAKGRPIDWTRVWTAMHRAGLHGGVVSRPQALRFWRSFDRTRDGRLDMAHGEFQRAYDAVWGHGMADYRHARPSYSAFDEHPFG
jgi:hypothetical protein